MLKIPGPEPMLDRVISLGLGDLIQSPDLDESALFEQAPDNPESCRDALDKLLEPAFLALKMTSTAKWFKKLKTLLWIHTTNNMRETTMKNTKIVRNELGQMLADYHNNLISPMDDMYEEGIIPSCVFFQISNGDNGSGFFTVNDENSILQFYLNDNELENIERIFDEVISQNEIGKALVCSNDPVFYDQCRRKEADIVPHDYMFLEDEKVAKPMPFEGITSERPNIDQLQELLSYFEGIGMAGDWLTYYLTQRINTRSIMLYRQYEYGILQNHNKLGICLLSQD